MSDSNAGIEKDRIEEIKARLTAATPGPWHSTWDDEVEDVEESDVMDNVVVISRAMDVANDDRMVVGGMYYDGMWAACRRENAALIAHAPEDIQYLLDRVAELERVVAHGGHLPPMILSEPDTDVGIWALRRDDLNDAILRADIGDASGVRYIAFRGGQRVAKARIVAAISRLIGPLLYSANSYGSERIIDDQPSRDGMY